VNKLEDTEEAFKGCNSKKDSYYKCPKSGKHNTERILSSVHTGADRSTKSLIANTV
jgi:hypothetical protein